MKLFKLASIVLLLGLIGCQERSDTVTITGKITGTIPDVIEYTVPIDGIIFFGFEDSVQPDSLGNFQITLDVDKSGFVELSNGYQAYGTIIVSPGLSYSIFINIGENENTFKVEGENEKGQDLYNQIANRSMIAGGHFEFEAGDYRQDTLGAIIKQNIKKSEETEIAEFRKLFEDKIISEDFYNLVKNDRAYYYKGVQGSVGFINAMLSQRGRNSLDKEVYTALWSEVFQSHPISEPKLMQSPWFYYYTQLYLRYNELNVDSVDQETISELHKQGANHRHQIEYAKKYLSGNQLEYYYAAYIYTEAINKNYEKELILVFEQFKNEYPTSEYSFYLEPEIIPIIAFHKKQDEPLNDKIKFIADSINNNSLKDVVKNLEGKRIYVDVWATWCGPCKKEFMHNAELYELLKANDVTILYLSIDKENRETRWRDMINYYNLEGYHIRANEKLNADLRNLRGDDTFGIPWHILTDANGDVIKKYVGSPSEIKQLEKQLDET